MKKFLLILVVCFAFTQVKSQTIDNISYSPASPTSADTIYFYVDLTFTSGGCPLSNSGSSVVGNTVLASALHCVGMLAVICNITDTFIVLPQAAGNYTFDMTLSSGSGGPPCSPGIVPDDNQTLGFTISPATGILEKDFNPIIGIAPNPSTGIFRLSNLKNTNIVLFDILGNELLNEANLNRDYTLDLISYPKGVYLMKSITNGNTRSYRLLKK